MNNGISEKDFVYSDAFQIHIKIPLGMNDEDLQRQILNNQAIVEKVKALPFPVTHEENQEFIKQLMFIMNFTEHSEGDLK